MLDNNLNLPIDLEELRRILRHYGVIKASVFGSCSRGENREGSDLDLLVKLDEGRTYLDLGGLQFELSQKISGGVDIMTSINRHFEPLIRNDLVEIL